MRHIHPRRTDREITDSSEIAGILKKGKYASIAMAVLNEPYIVTLNYGYDETAGCLYFHCALNGHKLDMLQANTKVCATVIEDGGYIPDHCEHVYASVVIRGEMSLVTALEEKKHGLEVLLRHLEKHPDPIRERNIRNDASYDRVGILRLSIHHISGKKGK
jgi:nitroimidazol reductase NimA-like FMN-containing flavoprotein (pyridoxamine 5'-phosphate oxidase superfamily)